MPKNNKACDVFISYSTGGGTHAMEAADACRASGLEALTFTELLPSEDVDDALWEALAESRVLLVILPPSGPTTSMAIEIGAARAWNKPIFAIVIDPSSTRLPQALSDIRLLTTGRIQDVIKAIDLSSKELSDEDRSFLIKFYFRMDVSVDQLTIDPGQLGDLAKKFNRGRHKDVSGEHLLSELLRMLKQGKLTKKTSRGQSRSHSDST
jgi:hypothetical protein